MSSRTFARLPARRSATVRGWWARAVASAAEEAAYDPDDLTRGAGLARRGEVGRIEVAEGRAVAAVVEREVPHPVEVTWPVMTPDEVEALVEVVTGAVGWIASLLRGEVPDGLDEALEEVGVELLPYGGLTFRCTCESWVDPCRHALALLTQVAWLVEEDPLVLLHLRGVSRERLVEEAAGVAEGASGGSAGGGASGGTEAALLPDLDVAVEAAEQAAAWLEQEEWAG